MKWYSKDSKTMIDLESINGYVYTLAEDVIKNGDNSVEEFKTNGDMIQVIIGGGTFVFRGNDAKEIYELLTTNTKQVLKG